MSMTFLTGVLLGLLTELLLLLWRAAAARVGVDTTEESKRGRDDLWGVGAGGGGGGSCAGLVVVGGGSGSDGGGALPLHVLVLMLLQLLASGSLTRPVTVSTTYKFNPKNIKQFIRSVMVRVMGFTGLLVFIHNLPSVNIL